MRGRDSMSFAIRKLRVAEDDAVDAAVWYEEREPGLGDEFLNEVDAAVLALARDAYFIAFALRTSVVLPCAASSFMASTI